MAMRKTRSQILKQRQRKPRKNIFMLLIKWCLILAFLGTLAGCAGLAGLYYYLNRDLPKINSLKDYRPSTVTSVYSDDGRKIGEFYKERRIVIPLDQMPANLINAFVAAEDSRFREHPGIDIISIIRAFLKNFQAGTIVQGGLQGFEIPCRCHQFDLALTVHYHHVKFSELQKYDLFQKPASCLKFSGPGKK